MAFDKKHILRKFSIILSGIFFLSLLPHSTLHHLFSSHNLKDDLHCALHHKDMGVHIEESVADCPILSFKAQTFFLTFLFFGLSVFSVRPFFTVNLKLSYSSVSVTSCKGRAPPYLS
ncbi:MAG: hypothetical protein N3F09_07335 [Bacteroidia bacterium]|nr:hypothetical protein [Bacteroidia bacterium]